MADGGGEVQLGKLLFSFEGRINRGTFWKVFFGSIVVAVGLGMLLAIVIPMFAGGAAAGGGAEVPADGTGGGVGGTIALVAMVVFYGVAIWISFATQAKRWHDLDKSGWMVLLNLIPLVGLIAFLYAGFAAGTPGSNRFGSEPA